MKKLLLLAQNIKIPYPTICWDSCWKEIVIGYGKYQIGVGCVFWKRLIGIS